MSGDVARTRSDPVLRGDLTRSRSTPARATFRARSASTPGRSSTSTTTTSRSRVTPTCELARCVLHRLRVRNQDVQLGALTGADARGGGDVHPRIADRGRHLGQRAGGVLDVDDQVDRHAQVRAQPTRECARDPDGRPPFPLFGLIARKKRRGGAAGGRGSTRPAPRLRVGSQGGISDAIVPGGGTGPGTSLVKLVRPPASFDYSPFGRAVSTPAARFPSRGARSARFRSPRRRARGA